MEAISVASADMPRQSAPICEPGRYPAGSWDQTGLRGRGITRGTLNDIHMQTRLTTGAAESDLAS
jgi:hypothetical protein